MSLYEATYTKMPKLKREALVTTQPMSIEKFSTSWIFIMEQSSILLDKEIRDLCVLKLFLRMITWK